MENPRTFGFTTALAFALGDLHWLVVRTVDGSEIRRTTPGTYSKPQPQLVSRISEPSTVSPLNVGKWIFVLPLSNGRNLWLVNGGYT